MPAIFLPWLGDETFQRIVAFGNNIFIPLPNCQGGSLDNPAWSFQGINIPFGRLSFGQAKAVDLAWDWVAGRGIQAVLVAICYRVFTDALMRATEVHHVSYEVFTSLALFSTKTDPLWYLTKGLFLTPSWRVKFMLAWLLISTAYLATFPALMDVVSGYDASNLTFLTLPSNRTININSSFVTEISMKSAEFVSSYDIYEFTNNSYYYVTPIDKMTLTAAMWEFAQATHVVNYLPTLQWYDQTLNKSWHDSISAYSSHLLITLTQQDDLQINISKNFYLADFNNFECSIETNIYHWGFSNGWLVIVLAVNGAWLIGLWIVWVDADHNSEFCRKGRRMGIYRSIVDISEAIREDLRPNLCAYSEKELTAAIKRQPPLKYYVSEKEDDGLKAHIGLSSRKSAKVQLEWGKEYTG